MSTPSRLFAGVTLFVFGVIAVSYWHGPAVAQDKEQPKEKAAAVAKWEYRIVALRDRAGGFGPGGGGKKGGDSVGKAEEELNKLGEEGFEIAFVTAASESIPRGGFGGGGDGFAKGGDGPQHPVVYYTLRRAKK
jgi:hypothetical protein